MYLNTKMAHILQLLHDFMVSPILILNTNQIFTFDSFNAHTKKKKQTHKFILPLIFNMIDTNQKKVTLFTGMLAPYSSD